jgi:hypothetical protein
MQDRPDAAELLDTVAKFLEEELMPALDGPLAYRTRVAANLVRILQREAALAPAATARERDLLRTLTGAPDDDVARLSAQLATDIAAGRIAHDAAWRALVEIARAKLDIVRPGYDAYDAKGELP